MNSVSTKQLAAWLGMKYRAKEAAAHRDYGKAEEILLEVYERGKDLFGPNHGAVGLILLMLSDVCAKQGKTELAVKFREETRSIMSLYAWNSDK